jgi:hypothetical protein
LTSLIALRYGCRSGLLDLLEAAERLISARPARLGYEVVAVGLGQRMRRMSLAVGARRRRLPTKPFEIAELVGLLRRLIDSSAR